MIPPLAADMAMKSSSAVWQLDGMVLELMYRISCRPAAAVTVVQVLVEFSSLRLLDGELQELVHC